MPDCNLPTVDQKRFGYPRRLPPPLTGPSEKNHDKKYILKNTNKPRPKEKGAVETYLAPRPPSKGKIIGLDCHPDTFTAAVFVGQTHHDAKKITSRENLGLEALLEWARREFGPKDIFLLEAGSNSFEVCKRLKALGLNACVLESCHVGKHAKTPFVQKDIWRARCPRSHGCTKRRLAQEKSERSMPSRRIRRLQ